jgi:hypothetical protein
MYYRAGITPWFQVTPDLQITNPATGANKKTAVVHSKESCMAKCLGSIVALVALFVASVMPAYAQTPSQITRGELVMLTAEVKALDVATREITLAGPLGGEISGWVTEDVKNLAQVKVGDMVVVGYYQSIAVSAHKKGEANPLFTGGGSSSAAPGETPSAAEEKQAMETVTVVTADAKSRTLVVQKANGTLVTRAVLRPEFVEKLKTLKPGDQLDVVVTQASIAKVVPAAAGSKPEMAYTAGTLIVDRGKIVERSGSTLLIRNERDRVVRVVVDPEFKFMVDGKEMSVYDLKPGLVLTRTALRITNLEYVGQ